MRKNAAREEKKSRREFLKTGAALGAAAAMQSAASYARTIGANERVRTGWIGVGNRGGQLLELTLEHCSDAEVVAIADVYQPYLDFAVKQVGAGAKSHSDYRKLLEDSSIDAVVIASPDHWHAKHFVDSCRAGKDVYVEKPLSLTVAEGRVMANVAKETGRVTQMGAQRHSCPHMVEAAKLIREGGIGKVTLVRAFHLVNEFPNGIGMKGKTSPPPGLDWDLWLGPAPKIPFEELVWNYKFRWFWNYSGGQMTNFGTHYLDVIQMALGQEAPLSVASLGGRFAVEDGREIPDTCETIWQYKDCLVTFTQVNANDAAGMPGGAEIEFRGSNGTLYLYGNRYEIVPQEIQDGEYPARGPLNRGAASPKKMTLEPKTVKGALVHQDHLKEFFARVKDRKPCSCDVETGHRSTSTTLIANIALRTGAVLQWDAKAERFIGNDKANQMLSYEYRAPWKL